MGKPEERVNPCEPHFPEEADGRAAATAGAMLTLVPIAAHQLGLKHLPDPPSSVFDSDQITDSKSAHLWAFPIACWGWGAMERRQRRLYLRVSIAPQGSSWRSSWLRDVRWRGRLLLVQTHNPRRSVRLQ